MEGNSAATAGKKDTTEAAEELSEDLRVSLHDRGIDILVAQRLITLKSMEMALRAIDRKYFYSDDFFENNIHMLGSAEFLRKSEACITMHLLDQLRLRPGMSFLCIACDTGFINAVAGLILGPKGINHGLNLDRKKVQQAKRNIDEFAANSEFVSQFGFCVPEIEASNIMTMDYNKYDRIICLRESPAGKIAKTMEALKIGGKAVMVFKKKWKLTVRCSNQYYSCRLIHRVNVIDNALLQKPRENEVQKLPMLTPPTLLNMCRNVIRSEKKREVVSEHGLPERRPSIVEYIHPIRGSPRLKDVVLRRVAPEIEGMTLRFNRAGTRFEQNAIYRYERHLKAYMNKKKKHDIPLGNHMREKINKIPLPKPMIDFLNYNIKRFDKL